MANLGGYLEHFLIAQPLIVREIGRQGHLHYLWRKDEHHLL
tara:strand:- start:1698 stop:1820 length:123 start_codon:yes stop_codon:yes gene_type:complete